MKQGAVLDVVWTAAEISIAKVGTNLKGKLTIFAAFDPFFWFVDVLLTPVVHGRGVD